MSSEIPLEPFIVDDGPPPPKPNTLLIVLVAAGIPLLLIAGFIAWAFMATADVPATPQDRAVMVDIEHLAEFVEDYTPDPENGTLAKQEFFGGSVDVTYEYDVPDDPDELYLYCCLQILPTVPEAKLAYVVEQSASGIGLALSEEEVQTVTRNDLFSWGDESVFLILESDGEPFGNIFVARKGKIVYDVMVSGVYFDDEESIRDFLQPALDKVATYEP